MPKLSNRDLAAAFFEIAELLTIKGGEPHRVRAFQISGRLLEGLPEPVERMLAHGTLQKMAGIGEGTLHRIKQILRRGTCDDQVRLRAALPQGLRELLKIKGLGPRTVRQMYQRLRIADVEQLEAAALGGLLFKLPRFTVDKAHALLREIEVYKGRLGKAPLIVALATADAIAAELRAQPAALDVVHGGSLRRQKALIGDLDILACADDPAPLIEAFTRFSQATAVLSRGKESASIRLASHQQADLWVFPPESWGAGLHAFSGSKEHVVALRTRAGRMGLHISEHGVFTRDRRRLTSGREEEEIFHAVGLPFIPPVLRQHLGEIELAEEGRLPQLITAADLRGDLHCHTRDSDGTASAQEMARAAIDLGYEYLAITDHSQSLTVANGLDERRLTAQIEQLRRLEQNLGSLRILAGTEVDILPDGTLDLDPAVLRKLDWVVASVHERFDLDEEQMTARILRAMETGLVDAIGHPTGRKLGQREPYAVDLEKLFQAARRLGVAMEVNGGPYRMDLADVHCRQAREMGVMLVIDTDAHSPSDLARREFALAMAQRGWLEKRHVLNTREVAAVRDFRAQRLRRSGILVAVRGSGEVEPVKPSEVATNEASSMQEELVSTLRVAPLSDALRERLEGYLQHGDDPELEAALRQLSANPVQQAFNLLMTVQKGDAPTLSTRSRDR